ncbi:uncharacterized protein LOC132752365 [Ruditapes philippinarum]|uniref:uncharacterized protein LOC132752365 n=1 Tax=Ruditapes philippinarum TaxID=129788 RepID=UPI00295AEE48|nr:uncharacterized protein LOC132752365 [Ruditapes philippinarum]
MGLFLSKTDNFIEKCEKALMQLDTALSGLASSVDNVHVTVQLLLIQLNDLDSVSKNIEGKQRAVCLTKELLENIETSLYNQKFSSLQGVSSFMQLIREKPEFKPFMQQLKGIQNLSIDRYLADFQKKQKVKGPEKTTVESGDESGYSVDPESDDLGEEMKELTNINDELQVDLAVSNKEIQERDATIKALQEEVEMLKGELESKQPHIEKLPVQLYHQKRGELITHIREDLLSKLKTCLAQDNKELDVVTCETSYQIQPDQPLLILCTSSSRLGTDALNAIQGVLQKENTVLLIFHHKDVHALPNQTSDRVLTGPEFKALRGIYDMAFLSDKGIYVCNMNSLAIKSIIDFICYVSKENCLAKNPTNDKRSTVLSR